MPKLKITHKMNGYEGMCATLEFLGISVTEWDKIKEGKLKITKTKTTKS